MEPRLKWTKIILAAKIDTDTWYLILDDVGLSKQKLLYAPLCTIIHAILEVVYPTCRAHSTWKTVPDIHNALTEKNLTGYSYDSSGLSSWTGDHEGCRYLYCIQKKSSIFTLSLPVTILKVSVKSPLSHLFSSVVNPNSCRRSAYSNLFNPTTSFELSSVLVLNSLYLSWEKKTLLVYCILKVASRRIYTESKSCFV